MFFWLGVARRTQARQAERYWQTIPRVNAIDVLRRQMDQLFSDLAAVNRGESDIPPSAKPAWIPVNPELKFRSGFVAQAWIVQDVRIVTYGKCKSGSLK